MSGVFQWSRRRVSRKWCPSWGQMAMLEWMENVAEGWGKNVMGTECRWRSGRSASMPASLGHVVSGGLAQRCGCPCSIQPSHVPYPQPVAPTVMTQGGQGAASSPNTDWGCPRSACSARECRRQRLLRWAAQRGQPAARACFCSRGLQPGPHTGAFPGLHMFCTCSGRHCSCFWGHWEQEEMLAAAHIQNAPCSPSRPTCNPTCALLNHTPHAHARPRTHTLPCGVPHAARTPSPPLGAPGWGSTGQLHCSDWTLFMDSGEKFCPCSVPPPLCQAPEALLSLRAEESAVPEQQ